MSLKAIKLVILFLIILSLLVGAIYWLWQRQPKGPVQTDNTSLSDQKTKESKGAEKIDEIMPGNFSAFSENTVKLSGKNIGTSYIAIYSDGFNQVVKIKPDATFDAEVELEDGFNLVNFAAVSPDFSTTQKLLYQYFVTNKSGAKTVYGGSVKSIFDNLITLTTEDGDKKISVDGDGEIKIPGDDESQTQDLKSVRIGDYAIALGSQMRDEILAATYFEVKRSDKPQIQKEFKVVKILSPVDRLNIFNAQSPQDNQTLELTISKSSQIMLGGKADKKEAILKDKTAFVFYSTSGDKKSVHEIYILP